MDNAHLASDDTKNNLRAWQDCREYLLITLGIDPLEAFQALPWRAIEAAVDDLHAIDRDHPEARRACERILDRLATFRDWYEDECARLGVSA